MLLQQPSSTLCSKLTSLHAFIGSSICAFTALRSLTAEDQFGYWGCGPLLQQLATSSLSGLQSLCLQRTCVTDAEAGTLLRLQHLTSLQVSSLLMLRAKLLGTQPGCKLKRLHVDNINGVALTVFA